MRRTNKIRGRIKIVYLIGELGLGGSERQLFLLLKHFDQTLFELHVVVFNRSQHLVYNETLIGLGIIVHAVPPDCRSILQRVYFLHHLIQEIRPHILHSWTMHDNPYAGLLGWLHGIPVRWGSVRGSIVSRGFQRLPVLLRWLSLRSVSKLTVNSESIVRDLLDQGLQKKDILLIPNCVDCSVPTRLPDLSQYGIRDTQLLIGAVGNLRRVKNHPMFVESMARVLPSSTDLAAVIVGQTVPDDTDLPELINSRIEELDLKDRLIMMGFYPDVPALMHRLSVYCLTSNSEGVPNAMLEAMAAARPVVATRVGGVPDIVRDNVCGFLIEPGDLEGFTKAVLKLLNDPELSRRMGVAGQEIVKKNHSCETITCQLAQLYIQSLERHL